MKTEKKLPRQPKLPDYILRRLPRHQWKLLREVPTWEGVLYYDPLDFQLDRPLTFYRRLYCWQLATDIIYPLRVHKTNCKHSAIKRGSKCKPMYRRYISFNWKPNLPGKGKFKTLFCHKLTMLCLTGFAIADPRHWVVDHIDGNPLNDRPSNLQVISQSENLRRSEEFREQALRNIEAYNARRRRAKTSPPSKMTEICDLCPIGKNCEMYHHADDWLCWKDWKDFHTNQ